MAIVGGASMALGFINAYLIKMKQAVRGRG